MLEKEDINNLSIILFKTDYVGWNYLNYFNIVEKYRLKSRRRGSDINNLSYFFVSKIDDVRWNYLVFWYCREEIEKKNKGHIILIYDEIALRLQVYLLSKTFFSLVLNNALLSVFNSCIIEFQTFAPLKRILNFP